MDYLIGLDIGTTAIKGALMSVEGRVLDTFSGGYNYFGENSTKLLNPSEFLDICFSVIKKLTDSLSEGDKVVAVCSCCASGNLILLDENSEPITPIIGWQTQVDKADIDAFLTEEEQKEFYNIVGWPLGKGFPAAYLIALKAHYPEKINRADMVAMSAEYLNFALTGKWGISHSMGTPFFLINQAKGEYNTPFLEKLGIGVDKLSPIYNKGTVLGTVKNEVAATLGLSHDTKVVLGSFDHPSGAMGAGVFEEGEMLLSCGTSWVEFFPVSSREFAISTRGLVDRFMLHGAPYCVMKSITSISEKIDALRLRYLGKISHKEFDELASSAPFGCNGLSFSFADDDNAINGKYSKADIARAIIESAATILKNNLENLEKVGLRAEKVTMIGGISNSPVCVKIISEVLDRPVRVANGQAAGAIGAAMLAGIGAGLYKNEREAFSVISK